MLLATKNADAGPDQRHVVRRTNPVLLPDFTAARREPTRTVEFRNENFEREFDNTTLFYDAADTGDQRVVLFAPPFFNLAGSLSATDFFQGSLRCPAQIRNLDRHAQL